MRSIAIFPKRYLMVLACAAIAIFSGCSKDDETPSTPSQAKTVVGETKTIGAATLKSWVQLDDAGNPSSIGLTFTENFFSELPSTNASYELTFPQQATMTPYDHISLDWQFHGHGPQHIYDVPHFDMHFYTVSKTERQAVIPGDDTTPVEAQYIPKDYTVPGPPEAVPMMGVHWLDSLSSEFHGHAFNHTYIWGFYKGKMMFHEPMITRAFLESKTNVTVDLKQPQAYQRTGLYYPTKYSIKYNATTKEYTCSLEGLTKR